MRATFTALLVLLISIPSFSQTELTPGYYVVVAAYNKNSEGLAKTFCNSLKAKELEATYGFDATKNLFFVFTTSSQDLKEALSEMKQTRKTEQFSDAWVRVVPGSKTTQSKALESADVTKDMTPEEKQSLNQEAVTVSKATEVQTTEPAIDSASQEVPEEKIIQYNPMTLGNTEVFLSLFNGAKEKVVEGEVQVIDTERSKLITKVKGNNYLLLPDPKSKSGLLTLICDSFGYRKVQHELHYPLPLSDTVKEHIDLMGTTIVVLFDLIRYRKGDIQTLYNVYFFNDASIMLPESKYELNSLLTMMEENPKYRIKLHGHTNGHYHGKIISSGSDRNLFSLTGSVQSIGSAKDLSGQRAGVIKEYLVTNGISADRIEVKSWGGKRPLYDKHSVNAKKNVRVEVEILDE